MAIENLQKSEGIASHKSSLLNSHVSHPETARINKNAALLSSQAEAEEILYAPYS